MNRIDSFAFNPISFGRHLAEPVNGLSRRTVHRAIPIGTPAGRSDGFESAVPPSTSGCILRAYPVDFLQPVQLTATPQPPAGWFAQGQNNACGTTSLSYVLWRLGAGYIPHQTIDTSIRNLNTFSDPQDLMDFARSKGMQARLYNDGSFESLQAQLSQGRQVMVMVDPDNPQNLNAHWMAVTAVGTGADGKRWVEYMDPGTGTIHRSDWSTFDSKWQNIRMDGIPTGYDRAYILVDRANARALPPSTGSDVTPISDAANGINDVVNGLGFLGRGLIFGGLGRIFGGLWGLPFTVTGTLLAAFGGWLGQKADGLASTAANLWRSGGLLGKLAAPFVGLASGAVRIVGGVVSAVGDAAAAVGKGIATVVKGVGDAIDAGIHAIGSFFSSIF